MSCWLIGSKLCREKEEFSMTPRILAWVTKFLVALIKTVGITEDQVQGISYASDTHLTWLGKSGWTPLCGWMGESGLELLT